MSIVYRVTAVKQVREKNHVKSCDRLDQIC